MTSEKGSDSISERNAESKTVLGYETERRTM